jgi:hypothetical protein
MNCIIDIKEKKKKLDHFIAACILQSKNNLSKKKIWGVDITLTRKTNILNDFSDRTKPLKAQPKMKVELSGRLF